ncbi:MAG: 30S ribosomal protein S13 [Candidatus Aenigmarchaeota archaeon]|nr:30S ribosomal protein S13 [Candidatus Aenigmarchaeota archaeon]
MVEQKMQKIVRILSTDIPGDLAVLRAVRKVKGVSFMFARALCQVTHLDGSEQVGLLTPQQIKSIEEAIQNPPVPSWLLNRRKDPTTGVSSHVVMAKLDFQLREDVNKLRKMRSYRGVRHELGLPVRGQRTRSSFRKNTTVGVSKKKAMAAPAAKPSAPKPQVK